MALRKFLTTTDRRLRRQAEHEITSADELEILFQNINNLSNIFNYDIQIGNTFRNLRNYDNIDELLGAIINDDVDISGFSVSDQDLILNFRNVNDDVTIIRNRRGRARASGGFFKYLNKTDINLKRYGIYKVVDKKNYITNCLIKALKNSGLFTKEEIQHSLTYIKNRYVTDLSLSKLVKILNLKIIMKTYNKNLKKQGNKVIGNGEKVINLGNIDNHYFIDEPVEFTYFSLKHYEDVKHLKDWNQIVRFSKGYPEREEKYITSFKLIKYLYQENKFEEITKTDELYKTQFYDKVSKIKDLSYPPACVQPVEFKPIKEKYSWVDKTIYHFDFETITDTETHEPYLCWIYNDNTEKEFKGKDCGLKMLKFLHRKHGKDKIIMIAHNLKYDYTFIIKHLTADRNLIMPNNRLMCVMGNFFELQIKLKDSYCFISKPLRDFGEMFKLEQGKEILPYGAYNKETVNKKTIKIDYAVSHLKDPTDEKEFIENIDKWGLRVDEDSFKHIKYSSIYCRLDCIVNKLGFDIYRKDVKKVTGLDIIDYVSNASIADNYYKSKGCFDGCYELSGVPREFIQKCVVGGRTMMANNQPIRVEGEIADTDANSLYPAAEVEMCKEEGFLKGIPSVIENLDYEYIKRNYDGYFLEINVLDIPIRRKFPLLSKKNEEGIRVFSNDIRGSVYITKIGLEDAIEFQDVKFEVIRGYGFDQGFNNKRGKEVQMLYDIRKKYKAEGNPIQEVYKIIMNSGYGRTIMKPIDEQTIFKNKNDTAIYLSKNYNFYKSYIRVTPNKFYIKTVKGINEHFSRPHIGSEILAWSKRIMNRVMCLAEDLGIDMYYQDTDSIHIDFNKLDILEKAYMKKYNTTLFSKGVLGKFCSDFDIKDKEMDKSYEARAIESIFIEKKTYLDIIQYRLKDGSFKQTHHHRSKGIPGNCIKNYCKDEEITIPNLYRTRLEGTRYEIDMAKTGKVCFENQKDFSMKTLGTFKRTF